MSAAATWRRVDRRAFVATCGLAVAWAALGACSPAGTSAGAEPGSGDDAAEPSTAKVVRRDLEESTSFDGTLGFGTERALVSARQGTVTKVADLGTVVTQGGELWRVDGVPVVLFIGTTPLWRELSTAATANDDVVVLKRNLRDLGYYDGLLFVDDDTFDGATRLAVNRWQEALGITATGTVPTGSVVVVPAPVRVAAVNTDVGGMAQGTVLTASGTERVVTVALEADERSTMPAASPVRVKLPGGKKVAATVQAVGRSVTEPEDANSPGGGGTATVDVTITVDDPASVGDLDAAPVTVDVVTASVQDVLAVPVGALVVLREGGLAVERLEAGARQYVKVETGMYADGWVQVDGALDVDDLVVVTR